MPRRRKGNLREEIYHQLDNNIDFSIVAYFFQVHKQLFNLERIHSKEEFADELIAEEISDQFEEDVVKFLKFLTDSKEINSSNWEQCAEDQLDLIGVTDSPIQEVDFADLSRERKAKVLKQLVDVALQFRGEELQKFRATLSAAGELTFEPIGCDKDGNKYWHFGGTKLYREYAKERKGWDICCSTRDQWLALIDSLKRVNDKPVKLFLARLRGDVWPNVERKFQASDAATSTEIKLKTAKRQRAKKPQVEAQEMHLLNGNAIHRTESKIDQIAKNTGEKTTKAKKNGTKRLITTNGDHEEKHDHDEEGDERKEMRGVVSMSSADNDERDSVARSSSPGMDLSVFEPRSKRRCVLALEKEKDARKGWWDGDEEVDEVSDDDLEDEADGDYGDGAVPVADASHRRRILSTAKSQTKKEAQPASLSTPNRMYAFSTVLANQAAIAVAKGTFESIISFHREQEWEGPYLTAEKHCRQPAAAPVVQVVAVPATVDPVAAPAPASPERVDETEPPEEVIEERKPPLVAPLPPAIEPVARPAIVKSSELRKSAESDRQSPRIVFPNGSRIPASSQQLPPTSYPPATMTERELVMDDWQRVQVLQTLRHNSNQVPSPVRNDVHPYMFNTGFGHPASSPVAMYGRPPLYGAPPHDFERMARSVHGRYQGASQYEAIAAQHQQQQQQRCMSKDGTAYCTAPGKFGKTDARSDYMSPLQQSRNLMSSVMADQSHRVSPGVVMARTKMEADARAAASSKARTPEVPFPFDTSQQLRPQSTASPSGRPARDSPRPVYMDLSNSRASSSSAHHSPSVPSLLMASSDRGSTPNTPSVIQSSGSMRRGSPAASSSEGSLTAVHRPRYSPAARNMDVASLVSRQPHPLAGQSAVMSPQASRGHPLQQFASAETKVPSRTSFSVESLAAPTFRSEGSAFQHPRAPYPAFPYGPGAYPPYHRLPPGYLPQTPTHYDQFYDGRVPTNATSSRNSNGR